MRRLADLQRRFARALASGDVMIDPRVIIYRHAMRANYRRALRATYPVICALTGAPFFDAAVDVFAAECPSRSGDLNAYGDTFGAFLGHYPPAGTLPYLTDVARLEWSIDEAQRAAAPATTPEQLLLELAAVRPSQLASRRFGLDPSCRLLHCDFPALRIWQVHQPDFAGPPDVDFDSEPDSLLLRRDQGTVTIERISPAEFAFLRALHDGEAIAAALDAASRVDTHFDFERVIRHRIADDTLSFLHRH
jgi:hypothetical protein